MTAPTGQAGGRRAAVRLLLPVTEGALVALTLAAVLGLGRLLEDGSFFPPVATAAVLAHLTIGTCRRRGLSPLAAAGVSAAAMVLAITWLQLPETTTLGIPTGATLSQAATELREAWRVFGDVSAPAPVVPGFVLAASAGAWWTAVAADTAAFRASAPAEAALPATTLFVFGAALGAPENRTLLTVVFLAALLGYWVAQRALGHASSPTWMSRDAYGGTRSVLRAGAVIGILAIAAGVVFGPRLPGAGAEAVIPWRGSDRDGPASRVTISPLVDIRARMVDQADVEAFVVQSGERAYWRLTSLEEFDGQIWKSNRQYRPARGRLDAGVETDDEGRPSLRQRFTIRYLDSIWLPAAFRPVSLAGTEARYDSDSNSLLTEQETVAGLEYEVESVLPVAFTPEQLAAVPARAPSSVAEEYLALPEGFSAAVRDEAQRIVAGATSQFDKARRLQDHLRGDAFAYDLSIPPGHGGNALERFLFETRRGYCEQFAGAYAAMARAVDLPARVAVGFTAGDAVGESTYSVRGYHGHAWPEVYLDGYGWVPFEPTPGRGIPGGESYTGVPEAQATGGDASTATTLDTTTTTAPAPTDPGAPTTVPDFGDVGDSGAGDAPETGGEASPWPRRLLLAASVLVAVPVLWMSLLAGVRALRRWRRRRRAATPPARVLVAWEEVGEALRRIGAEQRPFETPSEFARRAAASTGRDPRLLGGLAGVTTTAGFAPPETIADDVVAQALQVADRLERDAGAAMDGRQRLRHLVDPRPLMPARRVRVEVRGDGDTGDDPVATPGRRA